MQIRSEVDDKYKWDLSGYCSSLKDALDGIKSLRSQFDKLCRFEGKLKDKQALFECLEEEESLNLRFQILSIYCGLRCEEDETNTEAEEAGNIIGAIASEISVKLSFIDAEINKFSYSYLNELINDSKFAKYKEMFQEVKRLKKHCLNKKEEEILARVSTFSSGFSEVFSVFDSCEVKFKKAKDSNGKSHIVDNATYPLLVSDNDAKLRESSFKSLHMAFGELNKTLATNYINSVKVDVASSKIKKFNSSLESALCYENIPKLVYEKLIRKVNKNLNLLYRYFDLKKKMLGLKTFKICDAYAENPNIVKKQYTFEQAYDILFQALRPLGKEYIELIKRSQREKWVDAMPNKGKCTGAFSSGAYGKNPVILMNFVGDVESVFTLAHELGHSIHTYLSNTNQNSINADYPIFLAEIASTTNEMLLLNYFLENSNDDQEKIYFLDKFLSMVKSTIFRQTMFAQFEQIVHEQYENLQPISADMLNQIYFDLNKLYFGENVKILDCVKYEWSYIPHFYNAFYVYKYATGLISAIDISSQILKDNNFSKKYLSMLSMGGKLSPMQTLNMCDVDFTKNDVYDVAFKIIKDRLSQLSKLL